MNLKASIKVKLFGINEKDTAKFSTIFQISRPNKSSYCVEESVGTENIDIAIVNTDSSLANEQYKLFNNENQKVALVTVGSNQSPHHISGMLLPSRVYRILDNVPLAENHESPSILDNPESRPKQPISPSIKSKATLPKVNPNLIYFGDVEPKAVVPEAVEPQVVEPQVVESQAVESQAVESQAVESQAVESQAVESQAVEPQAVEPQAVESEVVESEVAVERGIAEQELAYQVLVVDDSESMQKALQLELEQVDCALSIDFALSGEEGLKRIDEKKYDLIFMDVMMPLPGIDGFEACSIIRKIPEMKKTPIIMLTSKTSPLDEVKGIVSGCTTYLTKPLKKDNFQSVMKRVLKWLENYRKE